MTRVTPEALCCVRQSGNSVWGEIETDAALRKPESPMTDLAVFVWFTPRNLQTRALFVWDQRRRSPSYRPETPLSPLEHGRAGCRHVEWTCSRFVYHRTHTKTIELALRRIMRSLALSTLERTQTAMVSGEES